ncbi:MAG: hypothetical protein AAGF23_10320 [Acidobacteriota bacterium]
MNAVTNVVQDAVPDVVANEVQAAETRPTLMTWARAAADLMRRWELKPHDGYLASESVLALQGYDVAPQAHWDRRFELHLDDARLPWTPREEESEVIEPPADVRPLTPDVDAPLHLYSTRKYSLPVTFLKPLELEQGEIHIIAPRGIARFYTVDVIQLIAQKRAPTPEEEAFLRRGSARLAVFADYDWPRRDRWFAKFSTELITIRDNILAGSPPRPSQMEKFGRRFSVV